MVFFDKVDLSCFFLFGTNNGAITLCVTRFFFFSSIRSNNIRKKFSRRRKSAKGEKKSLGGEINLGRGSISEEFSRKKRGRGREGGREGFQGEIFNIGRRIRRNV